jgi:hypothetical protein
MVAEVAVRFVGPFGIFTMVTGVVAAIVPLVTETVYGPPALVPEVNSPFESMLSPPETLHEKAGCGVMALQDAS